MGFIRRTLAPLVISIAMFPSPYGAWVSSAYTCILRKEENVSVPLRGMGFIRLTAGNINASENVSVPLRGMGFIAKMHMLTSTSKRIVE